MTNTIFRKRVWLALSGSLVFALLPAGAFAQQPPPPDDPNAAHPSNAGNNSQNPPDKKDDQAPQPTTQGDDSNPEPPHPPIAPASALFRLGGGGLLTTNQSPLRLGPLYVSSAEVFGGMDRLTPSDSTLPPLSQTGTVFRSDIVLDEVYKQSRFTAQWEPHLSIFDGVTRGDAENINVLGQTTFQFNERLGLTLSDNFSDIASRLLYGDFFFASGLAETPASQQNSFLDAPGHAISEQALALLTYRLSPLTTISFQPSYNYFHTNTTTALLNSSQEYAGVLSLTHTTSPRTTVGMGYTASEVLFPTGSESVLYQTVSGTLVHLLSPSFSFNGTAGFSTFTTPGTPRSWTFAGSATVVKSFRKSHISLGYNRGLYLADYTTSAFTDRVDAQASVDLNQRINVVVGGGFQRESRTDGFQGRYADGALNLRLAPTLTLYGRYTFSYQSGDQMFLTTGTRNLYLVGLRWDAGIRPKDQH